MVWNLPVTCYYVIKYYGRLYMIQRYSVKPERFAVFFICLLVCIVTAGAAGAGINDLKIAEHKVLDVDGFSCDLALDPRNGNLHVLWVSHGELKHTVRFFTGSWSAVETVSTGGRVVHGQEEADAARKCAAIDIDATGLCHIVFAYAGGEIFYLSGTPGSWSSPVQIVEKGRYSIFTDIAVSGGSIYVVYEDADPDKIYSVIQSQGVWGNPQLIATGEYPALERGFDGTVYFLCRGTNATQHNAKFGYIYPGDTEWTIKRNVTNAPSRLGHGPGMAVGTDKVYIAWNSSTGVEVGEKKTELYCAQADIPGNTWNPRMGSTEPIYYENTGDPHSRVAIYSDGLILYMNGARKERFAVWDGHAWSSTRNAPWNDNNSYGDKHYLALANDGRTVWVASSSAGYTNKTVSVSGITNPDATSNFDNLSNDAAALSIVPKTTMYEAGFSGRIAIDPVTGDLHTIWVSNGDIMHRTRQFGAQTWSDPETLPDNGAYVEGLENGQFLRYCADIDVDDQGGIHVVFASRDGSIGYLENTSGTWADPVVITSTSQGAIYTDIAAANGLCTVVYQDIAQGAVYYADGSGTAWSGAQSLSPGTHPSLAKNEQGYVYLAFNGTGTQTQVYTARKLPGLLDWDQPSAATNAKDETGAGPGICAGQGKVYVAWNNNTGAIGSFKSEMYCAVKEGPGADWTPSISEFLPLYYEDTGDPHPRAALYSDGTLLYMNGRRLDERFLVINEDGWSRTRSAPWENGVPDVASDGSTAWVLMSVTGSVSGEVGLYGIYNPDAEHAAYGNSIPQFTGSPDTSAQAGQVWSYTPAVSDENVSSLVFSLIEGPASMAIDASTGQVQWTPDQNDPDQDEYGMGAGVFLTGIQAVDEEGRIGVQYFRLRVYSANGAPAITSEPVETCYADSLYEYQVTAIDPDNDPYVFSLEQAPQAMYIGESTGLIQWTPARQDTGTHDITVRVEDSGGLHARQQYTLNVRIVYIEPQAQFSADVTEGTVPLTVDFTNESTGDTSSTAWVFGDGSSSTQVNPSHTYTQAGAYSVTLIVAGPAGTDTLTREDYITVSQQAPKAAFSADTTCGVLPLTVAFTNESSGDTTDTVWLFGDDSSSAQVNPVHTYQAAGVYSVTLIVTGPAGTDTLTKPDYITVQEPVPVADFSAEPLEGDAPLDVTFTQLATGTVTGWDWDFGDGGTSTGANPVHTYTAAGTYTVTLVVTGPGGSTGEVKDSYITVTDPGTAVEDRGAMPDSFTLYPNFPNPFNSSTSIRYDVPEAAVVKISVYSMLGTNVAELVNEFTRPGTYSVSWHGTSMSGANVPSGIYLVRLDASGFSAQRKILLVK